MLAFFLFLRYTEFMKYDYKTLYEKNAAFYNARPLAKRALVIGNLALTAFFILSYFIFCSFALFSNYGADQLLKLFFVPALGFFVVCVLRLAIDKPRPYSPDVAGITPFIDKKWHDNKSFPSRHATCAFVIAVTLLKFMPVIGILLLLLAVLLCYVRFAAGLHYPSDLFAGAGIGAAIGCLVFIL